MAAKWTKLSEIKADRDDWTIKVRVTRIWDGVNPSTKEIYNSNMILLDEEVSMTYHVIGILSKVFDIEDFGIKPGRTKPLFKKDITLTNKRGQELKVTLWSEQALEFENILKNQKTTEIVLIVCGCTVKEFNGNIHLSSTSATKIYANLNIKEANDLRDKMHNEIDQNFEIEMLPTPTKPTIEEIKLANRLTIDQILNMKFEDGQKEQSLQDIPRVVKNIVGRTFIFQVKITQFNIDKGYEDYTVNRVFEDTDVAEESAQMVTAMQVSKNPDAKDDTQKVQNSDPTTKRKRINNNSEAGHNATKPNDDTSQLEDSEDEEREHVPIVEQQPKVPERRESRRARKKKIIMDD
ncbi:hypothetical protein RJ639_011493 [Escallonia herrerae]|uniref:Replication protein A OB domain-containing protein n=1 Tax=Escallonia herrerae TaxID=1293975 RepID=A0AA88VKX5_9ASTE|nr:hypothetical protein RJ639_011493 [Escallonia herrerae]